MTVAGGGPVGSSPGRRAFGGRARGVGEADLADHRPAGTHRPACGCCACFGCAPDRVHRGAHGRRDPLRSSRRALTSWSAGSGRMIPRHTPGVGRAARVDRAASPAPGWPLTGRPLFGGCAGVEERQQLEHRDRTADQKNQQGGYGDQSEQPARGCDLDPDDQGQGQRRLDHNRGQHPPNGGHPAGRAPPAAEVGGDQRGGHQRREDHRLPNDHLHQVQHRRGAISPPGHTAAAGRDRRPPVEQLIELAGRPRSRPAENDVGELVDRGHDSDNRTSRNRRATHDRAQSEQTLWGSRSRLQPVTCGDDVPMLRT